MPLCVWIEQFVHLCTYDFAFHCIYIYLVLHCVAFIDFNFPHTDISFHSLNISHSEDSETILRGSSQPAGFSAEQLATAVQKAVQDALAEKEEASPPRKKQKKGQAGNDLTRTAAMRTQLENLTRKAIHAIRPCTEDGKHYDRLMYWDSVNPTACCKMLLQRCQDELKDAIIEEGGIDAMAEKYERVKKIANNERSIQSQTLRTIFLSHRNPETQLVARIQPGEYKVNDDDDVPLVTPDIKASGVKEVGDLRKLLFSNKLYTNQKVYNKWAEGMESGKLRSTKFVDPRTISKSITIAHEAHFRLDLYLTLQKRGYRHGPGPIEAKSRKKMWNKLLRKVYEDRQNNEASAHDKRMKALYPNGIPTADNDEDDSDEEFDAALYMS